MISRRFRDRAIMHRHSFTNRFPAKRYRPNEEVHGFQLHDGDPPMRLVNQQVNRQHQAIMTS
jgi:hypothetical protein